MLGREVSIQEITIKISWSTLQKNQCAIILIYRPLPTLYQNIKIHIKFLYTCMCVFVYNNCCRFFDSCFIIAFICAIFDIFIRLFGRIWRQITRLTSWHSICACPWSAVFDLIVCICSCLSYLFFDHDFINNSHREFFSFVLFLFVILEPLF